MLSIIRRRKQRMIRKKFSVLMVIAAALPMLLIFTDTLGATAVSTAELAREIDDFFNQRISADGPGAVALAVKDGRVVLRKGYGLANRGVFLTVSREGTGLYSQRSGGGKSALFASSESGLLVNSRGGLAFGIIEDVKDIRADVLGYWIIPIGIILSVAIYMGLTRLLRVLKRRHIQEEE
jgi:hypothetical protein